MTVKLEIGGRKENWKWISGQVKGDPAPRQYHATTMSGS